MAKLYLKSHCMYLFKLTCRLLLWDCDGRSYSYYIEVSTNQQHWTVVADKTKEACRSWQILTFEKRPITFIKIVGTHNTANEVKKQHDFLSKSKQLFNLLLDICVSDFRKKTLIFNHPYFRSFTVYILNAQLILLL